MSSGASSKFAVRPVILPVLLSLFLAAPALPQSAGRGSSSGAATALEVKSRAQSESSEQSDNQSNTVADSGERILLSNASPKQGEVVQVKISASDFAAAGNSASITADGAGPSLQVLGKKYKFFAEGDGDRQIFEALFAVPVVQKPGPYKMTVGSISRQFVVNDAHFQVQRLSLPKSKDNFITAPGEEEAVEKAKSTLSSERFWSGKFSRPSLARMSAPFGVRRIVNGKLLPDYFHAGLDFAGALGSPIFATAPGTVILAQGGGVFKLHGNVVAIDHGQGVISFYIHMQKVLVKVGQSVKQGEEIGRVGQTGRATGPHLHFSIYCNQVASSPNQWFAHAP